MVRRFLSLTLIFISLFFSVSVLDAGAIKIVSKEVNEKLNTEITVSDMFISFGEMYDSKIPESYKYIDVKMKGINNDKKLYSNIQKLVYVDVLKNVKITIKKSKKISAYNFYRFAEKNYKIDIIKVSEVNELKSRKATFNDFELLKKKFKIDRNSISLDWWNYELNNKKKIFSDVYNTLSNSHYSRDNLDKAKMIDEATKALTKATWDKHTVYFPPVDTKDFNESLNGEYEWIGAYVDMEKPWVFKIVSPLPDSPAEDAWLKWWDIVTHVNKKEITEDQSIREIVSNIKWKSGTEVLLTIKRWTRVFDVKVKRAHITIKEVEVKKLNNQTYYIRMKFFWPNISNEFKESLEVLKTDKKIKKIIFDLRWNWGWYLYQVSDILWHFVPKGEKTAVVKYYNNSQNYYSKWYSYIDFSKYKLIFLENGWTASASEIFIWTVKDYFPEATIIWEKSYGKWSVQTIKSYRDGSSLKYTIARWYTWKTEIWIDWIWIVPDIEIHMESYWVEEKDDKQLQKAIRLK